MIPNAEEDQWGIEKCAVGSHVELSQHLLSFLSTVFMRLDLIMQKFEYFACSRPKIGDFVTNLYETTMLITMSLPVSYTHLTLPTNREV